MTDMSATVVIEDEHDGKDTLKCREDIGDTDILRVDGIDTQLLAGWAGEAGRAGEAEGVDIRILGGRIRDGNDVIAGEANRVNI